MPTIAEWWDEQRKRGWANPQYPNTDDTVDGWTRYTPEEVHEMNRRYTPLEIAKANRPVEEMVGDYADYGPANNERHPMSQRFVEIVQEMIDLHDKKQSDYGRDTDPFANVRGSTEWDMPAWVGAMVRAQDKIRRLQQYNKKGTLANEGARDAFMDLAVYAVIALCLWEEEEGE